MMNDPKKRDERLTGDVLITPRDDGIHAIDARARWSNPRPLPPGAPERWVVLPFDTRTRDHAKWRNLRGFLNWIDPGPGQWARQVYKTLRRFHNESKERTWEQALPPVIVRWADDVIRIESDGLHCVDNARVGKVGSSQMRRYRRQKDDGCCGSSDTVHTGPDGKRYAIGFNFGH